MSPILTPREMEANMLVFGSLDPHRRMLLVGDDDLSTESYAALLEVHCDQSEAMVEVWITCKPGDEKLHNHGKFTSSELAVEAARRTIDGWWQEGSTSFGTIAAWAQYMDQPLQFKLTDGPQADPLVSFGEGARPVGPDPDHQLDALRYAMASGKVERHPMDDDRIRSFQAYGSLNPADPSGMARADILDSAAGCVMKDRNLLAGNPEDNFATIAALVNAYLKARYGRLYPEGQGGGATPWPGIDATDVAILMDCVKTARIATSPDHKDHWVDKAGYAACGWSCRQAVQRYEQGDE